VPHTSLKYRLIATTFAMTAACAVTFGFGVYFAFDAVEDELFDRHTDADMRTFIRQYERDPAVATLPRENFIVHIAPQGDVSVLPEYLRTLPNDADELRRDGKVYDVIRKRSGRTRFYFLLDETAVEAYESAMIRALAVIVVSMCAITFVLSWLVGRRIIAPIEALAARVAALDTSTGQEIDIVAGAPRDEVFVLASAIRAYQQRVRALLQRERDFSADVAHELRTPLAGVQGAAELIENRTAEQPALQELALRVRRGTARMTALIEALLYLARDRATVTDQYQTIELGEILDEQLTLLRELCERRGITFRYTVEAPGSVRGIPAVVSIVIGNLLRNAVTHTDHPKIDVVLTGARVTVEDYGPGIETGLQAVMFDRYSRGTNAHTGFGIGLALVRRFCDQFGWPVTVESKPGAGTRITIEFR
jgi:signal transduction histidine kinase